MATSVMKKSGRVWVAQPDPSDDAVRAATGRGWDEWCDVIDAWPGHEDGHTAIAAYVQGEHGVESWWAPNVTVGYERITGIRLPGQMADGTFSASASRTIAVDGGRLRERLLNEAGRRALIPGHATQLRSRPASKNVRLGLPEGSAEFSIETRADGKAKVVVSHTKLPSPTASAAWKAFWTKWLEALPTSTST